MIDCREHGVVAVNLQVISMTILRICEAWGLGDGGWCVVCGVQRHLDIGFWILVESG